MTAPVKLAILLGITEGKNSGCSFNGHATAHGGDFPLPCPSLCLQKKEYVDPHLSTIFYV